MKGYKVEDRLYIFPQTVDVIPEVEGADVIYVQHETVKAWKEANSDVADKIKGYNFLTMTVLPKEWAGHTDDDIEPAPEPKTDPELAWSEDSATVTIGADDNIFPTLSNPHSVTVDYSSSDGEKATIDASTGEITLLAEGETTISAAFVGDDTYEAQTVNYTLTVEAAQKADPELAWSADEVTVTIGADDNIFPTLSNPYNVDIYYPDYYGDVYTIDETTGEITLLGPGSAEVSAVFNGDDTYEAQTVSYAITVEAAAVETRPIIVDDQLNAIQQIFDNNAGQNIDTEAVPVGDYIQVNLNSGFTFNKEATEGTIVTATLNGDDISDSHGQNEFHYVTFEMPDEDSDLVVEEYTPNQ